MSTAARKRRYLTVNQAALKTKEPVESGDRLTRKSVVADQGPVGLDRIEVDVVEVVALAEFGKRWRMATRSR